MSFRVLLVAGAFIALFETTVLAQAEITREYCEAPGQTFQDQCAAFDPATQAAQCQAAIEVARSRCQDLKGSIGNDLVAWLLGVVQKNWVEISGAIAALLVAIFTIVVARTNEFLRKGMDSIQARILAPFRRRAPVSHNRGLNAVVVGLSGSGKTSVVRALSMSARADPKISTSVTCNYILTLDVLSSLEGEPDQRERVRVYVTDPVGQDFQKIDDGDFRSEKLSGLKKCLILVVDLFDPRKEYTDEERNSFDGKRVKKNIQVFHSDLVRVLTKDFRQNDHIILFINKIDMRLSIDVGVLSDAKKIYKDLVETIETFRGIKSSVVVGSTSTGLGLVSAEEAYGQKGVYMLLYEAAGLTV